MVADVSPTVLALMGVTLGEYRLERPIGLGGSGAVFLARRIQDDVPVAVKILILPWQADSAERAAYGARFRREVQVLHHLRHPHIMPILDFGEAGDLTFLVMPLMVAGSLHGRLSLERVLPLLDIATYLDQLADALDYAHAQGLIHRDVKPANALLDGAGNVYLADFGIVRYASAAATPLTETGHVVGTPSYMAPEVIRGHDVEPTSDIYSLGMLVYELVTGRTAFDGATIGETMLLQVQDAPPPPTALRADLPRSVEPVLLRALAKDPHDRFQTAAEFAAAFRLALLGGWDVPTQTQRAQPAAPWRPMLLATTLDALPTSLPAPATLAAPSSPRLRIAITMGMAFLVVASALFIVTRQVGRPLRLAGAEATPTVMVTSVPTDLPTATHIPPTPTTVPPPPTAVPTPLPGAQLLVNPSFEGYQGWCVWNNLTGQLVTCDHDGGFFYEEAYVRPYDGALYGVHYAAHAAYDVTTFQSLTTPADGYYSASIMAWSTCNTTAVLFLKDATTGASSDIANGACLVGGWTHIQVGPFFVPHGHYLEIEIRSAAGPGRYYRFDQAFVCYLTTNAPCA